MSIQQFLSIFLARKWLILLAPLCCLAGAIAVTFVAPHRWQATAEVMLDTLKPDPVTGEVFNGHQTQAYIATQTQLVTDYSTTGRAVDELGLEGTPNLIARYQARPASDRRDFRRWLADVVITPNTQAAVTQGSNILNITYLSSDPALATRIVEGVRTAYINESVRYRQDRAARAADWFDKQVIQDKAALDAAQAAEADYERQNNVLMQDDKVDVDSERLRSMAMQGSGVAPIMAPESIPTSPTSMELAQVDADIAKNSRILGPNHPDLVALKARRANLASLIAREEKEKRAAIDTVRTAQEKALQSQKARVVQEKDKISRLNQLQADVDVKRDQYNKTQAKATQLRQQADITEAELTPLGPALTPKAPVFPNYLIIVAGSLVLGLGTGLFVSLLMEFLGRRVRSEEDLTVAADAPVLAVIAAPPAPPGRLASLPRPWGQAFGKRIARA
jgi:uncharacterized protein involved in exopolysaccharide biosynthesis